MKEEKTPDVNAGQDVNIVDFDVIAPAQRLARIGGKVINVARIPSRTIINAAKFADDSAAGKLNNETSFMTALGLVAQICSLADDDITADWLLDKTDVEALMAFLEFVLAPIREKAKNVI